MLQDSIKRKLVFGFDRLAAALRTDQWSQAGAVGLNPTQILALEYVASRYAQGVRIKNIAEHLGVSQPTATDTIVALERKGLIKKKPDAKDARATSVLVTKQGSATLTSLAGAMLATLHIVAAITSISKAVIGPTAGVVVTAASMRSRLIVVVFGHTKLKSSVSP